MRCKRCGEEQSADGLDDGHRFCLHHTGDENAKGIGLVCLCLRDPEMWRGICPDCGAQVVVKPPSHT